MANCMNCIHNPVCDLWRLQVGQDAGSFQLSGCDHFKDRSRFVELPCKVGDTVYVINEKHPCFACWDCTDHCHLDCRISDRRNLVAKRAVVSSISYNQRNNEINLDIVSHNTQILHDYEMTYAFCDFGKTVFLSHEEAEKALKKRKGE